MRLGKTKSVGAVARGFDIFAVPYYGFLLELAFDESRSRLPAILLLSLSVMAVLLFVLQTRFEKQAFTLFQLWPALLLLVWVIMERGQYTRNPRPSQPFPSYLMKNWDDSILILLPWVVALAILLIVIRSGTKRESLSGENE